ncbi:MAG: hypothetical protein J2P17_01365 [Mycobacterium sp.]|nr:hypothetical protein [Mycobacterium sp.]
MSMKIFPQLRLAMDRCLAVQTLSGVPKGIESMQILVQEALSRYLVEEVQEGDGINIPGMPQRHQDS